MKLFSALVLASALVCSCSGKRADTDKSLSADDAASMLINRNWIDRWPSHKDERLHVYRFVPDMGGGVYQDRTLFLGSFELFVFDVGRETITFFMPDSHTKLTSRFRIERVSGPEPFDLRLTLAESPRGPRTYYGMSSETGSTWAELDSQLMAIGDAMDKKTGEN